MTIYLDLIFFINFCYDFLLLLTVSIVLKRNTKIYKHLLSAFFGGLSVFLLFLNINGILLFAFKILVSFIMILISFNYVSIRYTLNNLFYLYMTSVILAGFLYFLNIEFSYGHIGMLVFTKEFSINYVLLLIIAPIILFLYIRSTKNIKSTYNLYYKIIICFDKKIIRCTSLFDSGNNLTDCISKKSVIIVNKKVLKDIYNIRSPIYVPYTTISGNSLMKCYKPSYIIINNKKIYNYLIGESNIKIKDGIDAILNVKLMEDNYV